ncbi:MAG: carbohydrate ABC transporter substrate-binding protein [Lachnospiraceae bacterium]|nr:carbohydrate ABC transporter substrate-binding protein [Lachnospiraceae bacterium]
MKRKLLSMLLVGAMTVTMLAGCGNDSSKKTEGKADEKVTLKTVSMFGGTDPNKESYEAINAEFMKENSNVTIEDNSQTSDEEWKASVNADFSVGNEPDVIQFFTDATADSIIATNKMVTLEEIRAEYPDYAKDTLDSALEASRNTDGVSRAVPTTGYWEGLYCNKDLFDQYDLELPTDWASLEKAITTFKENGIIPIACSLNNVPHYWIEFLMLYSAGEEEYVSIPETAPEGWVKGLDLFKTLRDMGAFPEDTDTVDDAYVGQLFRDKKAAMQLDGSWYSGNIEDTENTVVIAFPGVPDQKAEKNSMIGGISSGFYITKKAWDDPAKREAAVKFVMAHTSQAGVQRYWESTGAVSQAAVEVTAPEDATPFAESIAAYTSSASAILAPTDARIGDAYKTLVSEIVKVSTGAMTAEDAINETLSLIK